MIELATTQDHEAHQADAQACRNALLVQDASNLIAVVLLWARDLRELHKAAGDRTPSLREHPACVLMVDKLSDMMGRPDLADYDLAHERCTECVRIADDIADRQEQPDPEPTTGPVLCGCESGAALVHQEGDILKCSRCGGQADPPGAPTHRQLIAGVSTGFVGSDPGVNPYDNPDDADPPQETPTTRPHVPQGERPATQGPINPLDPRIAEFLHLWHENGRSRFEHDYPNLNYDAESYRKSARDRKLYVALDNGTSGCFLLEKSTGLVYGIKAYGVIHRGHPAGHLDDLIRTCREATAHNREFGARRGLPRPPSSPAESPVRPPRKAKNR